MPEDLLAAFSPSVPYTPDSIAQAPRAPGVHVVLEDGDVIYVGSTRDLRSRMRQHVQGDRQASVLHEQVGNLLDGDDHVATATEIAQWLNACSVRWRETDDYQELKEELVDALRPRFNRALAQPRTGVWWVNQGISYPHERELGIVFAGTNGPQLQHRTNVGRMRVGDVTMHYRQGHVVALGEVIATPVRTLRPYGPRESRDAGLLTRIEYFPLDEPVALDELPDRVSTEGPFDRLGKVKQGYAFPVPTDYAAALRADFPDRWPAGSPWTSPDRRFWIFQANPAQWSLAVHMPGLAVDERIDWLVTRYRTDMRPGDGVMLWEAGSRSGIYGLTRIAGAPTLQPTAPYRPASSGDQEYRIPITVERQVLPPIRRDEARRHPVLSGMEILRAMPRGTNFTMTREQWRAVLAATPLGDDESGGSQMDDLAALVSQFHAETGYPEGMRDWRDAQREELAVALTIGGLADPDVQLLRRLAGPAYGSPGPQPGFNVLLQTDDGIRRVAETLSYLLHGAEGTVDQRLNACLSGTYKLPRVGEAMLVKALAVVDPERWIPCYPTGGKVGKLQILGLVGQEVPDPPTAGHLAAATNDQLRQLLEPYLPGDPWGMQEFSWWLLHRERVPETPVKQLADKLYLTEEFLERVLRLLDDKGQVVFYGPPGTGKTFVAQALAEHVARGGGVVRKIQFHPSYAYEDFVEGYRPTLVDGQLTYEIVDGPLKEIASDALKRQDLTHVLLIDELNRANVPRVLGELLYLLEYRDEQIRLQYSKDEFALPGNLRIIATMNTADRSVAQIDAALRRRFHFVPFFPDTPPIKYVLRRWLDDNHRDLLWIADLVDRANAQLANRHLAIGPSHFMKRGLDAEKAVLAWDHSVMPYLEEQFFADPERLIEFGWDKLRRLGQPEASAPERGDAVSEA